MKTWAIIPLKRLSEAKARLSSILTAEERRGLMLKLFNHTLNTCIAANVKCIVIAEDIEVEKLVVNSGQDFLLDYSGNLNKAIAKGLEYAKIKDFEKCLIVFADLPFLTIGNINNILHLLDYSSVIICPDLKLEGTNVVGIRRNANFFKPEFGNLSYIRFVRTLHDSKTYVSLGTSLDLDTPEQFRLAKSIGFALI